MTFQAGDKVSLLKNISNLQSGEEGFYVGDCGCGLRLCNFATVKFNGRLYWVPEILLRQHVRKSWFDIWNRRHQSADSA